MTYRKGEIMLPEIERHWPHHVALSADKVRGVMNSQIVWSFAETLSAAPRPYSLHRDDGDVSRTGRRQSTNTRARETLRSGPMSEPRPRAPGRSDSPCWRYSRMPQRQR